MKINDSLATNSCISIQPEPKEVTEDEISNGNTEDSLISSRTSSETLNTERKETRCYDKKKSKKLRYFGTIFGTFLITYGVFSLIYTPFQLFMDLRLEMTPGLPPFQWWLDPPDEVLMRVYLFNITNANQFVNGTDTKLKIKEIGPIIYREKLIHTNPIFNENGTLTYTANRTAIFLPEMNSIDLNDTIIMPNIAVLGIASYLSDAPFFAKMGVNVMMRSLNSKPFVETTIYNYLWNTTDPLLDVSQKLAPFLVPTKNVGVLARIYSNFVDNVTVYIGSKHSHEKFFLINTYDGSEKLPNLDRCKNLIVNSSEGVSYPQFLTKNYTMKYWRKSLCKVANLYYTSEEDLYGVTAYRFKLSPETFDRTAPLGEDCYKGVPTLPDGLSDVSACHYGLPVALSFPHFLYSNHTYVDGLEPNEEKHGSYVLAEPVTGVPLQGKARSQINLVVRNMRGFSERVRKFSDTVIPISWIEYHQVGIPWYIQLLTYFVVKIVFYGETPFSVSFILLGIFLIYSDIRKRKNRRYLNKNKMFKFESQTFIK